MSKIELTPDQKAAVYTRGASLLVSAAAGSGKTRVLTERLMAYVTDEQAPGDIDSFLIITYTRAAAAELRGRIMQELSKRCAESPQNRRLRRQSNLCYKAQIGTIHSFCTAILRENSHKLGLSPDFRVGDEDKCAELREKALEQTLDAAYEKIEEDAGFARLVGSVGAGRDDSRLAAAVLELFGKMQSHAYPEKWARAQLGRSLCRGVTDASETIWGRELLENAKSTVDYWLNRLDEVWFFINSDAEENEPIIKAYGESLCVSMEQLRELSLAIKQGWDKAREHAKIEFPRLKPLKNYDFEDRKALLTTARDGCKKAMATLAGQLDEPSEKLLADMAATSPSMDALIELTLEFDRLYSESKRRLNMVDFSDLEHFAVKLLCCEETGEATDTARELSRRYTEIMIDEYQDVSAVQDLIFRCISKNEKNLFMVGDVKQSIYRFRLADPSIFIKKYLEYAPAASAKGDEPRKILLQQNFRSDKKILAACNHVFRETMSPELGEISYDDQAALYPRSNAPERGCVSLAVLSAPQAEEGEERPDKLYLEAKHVALKIKNMVQSGETILEGEGERPLEYGDIAILLRSPNTAGGAYRRALRELGVPVAAEQGGGFFASPEIVVLRALLKVIDNPHRDIPLTATLMSSVFGFTADELSVIRAADKEGDFFAALCLAAEKDEKAAGFLETLNELRNLSQDLKVTQLLSLIYRRLSLPVLCAARGSENLSAITDLAAAFEENGYRGLYGFNAYLDRLEQRGEEPRSAAPEAGNAVAIMSIHKSKGLEFPVVFLCAASKKFNTMDLRSPVLIHPELGLGGKITDIERGIEYPSLARRAAASRLTNEMLSEELRVLYVAMTRAKERLYITCAMKDPEAQREKLMAGLSSPISPEVLKASPSMAHWLLAAALTDRENAMELQIVGSEEPEKPEEGAKDEAAPPCTEAEGFDSGALEALRAHLERPYAFSQSAALPSKLTATMLPGEEADREAQSMEKRPRLFRLPDFSGAERPLTGAEKGVATHLVMQYIDFSKTDTADEIAAEVERILALGILTPRQARAVDKNAVLSFFCSETGQKMKKAQHVMREFRFSLLCPAKLLLETEAEDEIMLQGVVDCCIDEPEGLTIIDYKTDYVTEDTLEEMTARYRRQILAYGYAMERICQKPVKACKLCFLRGGLEAEVK